MIVSIIFSIVVDVTVGRLPFVGDTVGASLLMPFTTIVFMLVYFNLRLAREPYTVDRLAADFNLREPSLF